MKEDIPTLAQYFLIGFTNELARGPMRFSPGAIDCLVRYSWPGNVRELQNELKRAAILAESDVIEESDLSENIRDEVRSNRDTFQCAPTEEGIYISNGTLEEMEIRLIKEALGRCGGNKQRASEILGLTRQGLIKKMKRHGLG